MLKRNKVLAVFMLVAVLCMSIGFAAISDTLTVNGSMSLNLGEDGPLNQEFDEKVYFTNPMTITANVTKSEISTDKDTYTFTIAPAAFAKVGDSVTITVGVKNDNTADAALTVSAVSEGALADFIAVTPTIDSTVAAGGSETLTIVVTLNVLPEDTTASDISFTITAKPAA